MHRFSITIDDGPINFDRIATSGQMFRWRSIESGWEINDGKDRHLVRNISESTFEVESNKDLQAFRNLLRLERRHDDMLVEIARLGPEMEPFFQDRIGLRIMRPSSKAETLFSFLCSANNHISRITGMVWKLASYGEEGFPSIDRLAQVTEQQLRDSGFGYRGATIPKVAQILSSNGGEEYLEQLSRVGYQIARQELIALPGVGKKLADCISLFAFDYGESIPIDTHIWQVMTRLYFPHWVDTNLTDTKYETVANAFRERFGEHAGAAHQYLFVDNMERYRERSKI